MATGHLFVQWHLAEQSQDHRPDFSTVVRRAEVEYLLVHRKGAIIWQPETLQSQFWDFLSTSCTLVNTVNDKAYGEIEIYRVLEAPPGPTDEQPQVPEHQ